MQARFATDGVCPPRGGGGPDAAASDLDIRADRQTLRSFEDRRPVDRGREPVAHRRGPQRRVLDLHDRAIEAASDLSAAMDVIAPFADPPLSRPVVLELLD